jgi:hypothetical protein
MARSSSPTRRSSRSPMPTSARSRERRLRALRELKIKNRRHRLRVGAPLPTDSIVFPAV